MTTLLKNPMLLSRLQRHGAAANSHDLIKAAAIVLMVIDHIGLYCLGNPLSLRLIGRGAAPLFFFATGNVAHSRIKKSLIVYGLLLTLLNLYTEHQLYFNILLNFALIQWALQHDHRFHSPLKLLLLFIALCLIHPFLSPWLEYGSFGLLFAFGARLQAQQHRAGKYWLAATLIYYFADESLLFNFIQNRYYEYGFLFLVFLLLIIFLYYRQRTWSFPAFLRLPILILSRYSLEIYFFHLAALKLYAYYKF